MTHVSITQSETFRLRAQRSEQVRTTIMVVTLASMLGLAVIRRLAGGVVMAENAVFIPAMTLIIGMLAYEVFARVMIARANRQGRLLEEWKWKANAALELLLALGLLTISQVYSPRGAVAAISAPPILVIPIIVMLSVLRLRPRVTLLTGIFAAAGHAGLTIWAIMSTATPRENQPVLMSYSLLLLLCGVAATLVSMTVRRYVSEAAEEATAREQAKLKLDTMEHELTIARDIQQGLLPSAPPVLEGFNIAGFYRPADLTGGDYYDWQALPDGKVAFVMADVVGHGIGPALVMAVCRAYARATAPLIPEPGVLLQRINALVHHDVRGMKFVTLAIALLEPANSQLQLASAGHGPTMLYRAADKTVEHFGGDGAPLGVIPDECYESSHTRQMAPGDILLLLTDGFFEYIGPDDEQFGIQRIEAVLKKNAGEAASRIIEQLDKAVQEFAKGGKQFDDMTAIVLKRIPAKDEPTG